VWVGGLSTSLTLPFPFAEVTFRRCAASGREDHGEEVVLVGVLEQNVA